MKLSIILSIFVFIGFCFTAVQTTAAIDPDTIVGLWLFDDGTGKEANDESGNGLDGALKGNVKWVAGKFGKALEFDGSSGYVEIPAHDSPREAITVSIWVKSKVAAWNENGFFMEKRNAYVFHPNANTKQVSWAVCNVGCWNKPHAWRTGEVTVDDIMEWHLYTATYDSNTGEWFIYVDGVEESKLALNKDPLDADNGSVFIGNDTCCAGRFGNIIVDEAAIFSVALSATDIKALYDKGLGDTVLAVDATGKITTTWGSVKNNY